MNRRIVFVVVAGCAVLATALAALFVPAVGVELHAAILTPLIAAFYTIRAYIERLPQLMLWVIPILITSAILFRLLFALPRREKPHRHERRPQAGDGKLAEMIRQIERSRVSRFARVRVCRQLSDSAMRLLARRHGVPIEEARRRLRNGQWEAEPSVVGFLTPHLHHRRPAAGKGFLVQLAGALTFLERYRQEI
jgi:hypothetical protein